MRTGHFPRKLLVSAVALLLFSAGSATAAQTYQEHAGDAPGGAPDVTAMTISHKLAGDVTFQVAFGNRSTLSGEDAVLVLIDSDQNSATGIEGGDWLVIVVGEAPGLGVLIRSDADEPTGVVPIAWANQAMTFGLNKAALGVTTAFNFGVVTHTGGAMSAANTEFVPHLGSAPLTYSVATEIATIQLPNAVATVKAGKVFSIRGSTVKLTTDEVFTPEALTAKATIGGKPVKAQPGGLSWKIPKTAKGKKLVVKMTATYQGMTKTQSLVVRVVK